MAKLINKTTHDIYWSDEDIVCPLEDAYWELHDFIAMKRLDGHDRTDQWYMLVCQKMDELLDALGNCPFDETNENLKPIY